MLKLGTAVSDLEVVQEEEDGFMWHINYPLVEPDTVKGLTHLTVATTRPETMLGDVAVMIHPEDERFNHLVGKFVKLPLSNRPIQIISDDYVDKGIWYRLLLRSRPHMTLMDYGGWATSKTTDDYCFLN